MPWRLIEDTKQPMMRWHTTLTPDSPDSGPLEMGLVGEPTVQVEGGFGGASVEISGSNSGTAYVPLTVFQHQDVLSVLPVYLLQAKLFNPDQTTTAVTVTVAGRR